METQPVSFMDTGVLPYLHSNVDDPPHEVEQVASIILRF